MLEWRDAGTQRVPHRGGYTRNVRMDFLKEDLSFISDQGHTGDT